MVMCDMCGADEKLLRTDVEGTILNVCEQCAKYGKVLGRVQEPAVARQKKQEPEPKRELVQVLAEDYAQRISRARQAMGMKQSDFAKLIREKESLVQKMEQGQFEPSINLARKLENHLRIKLVEQHEEKRSQKYKAGKTSLTIGDMIQIK